MISRISTHQPHASSAVDPYASIQSTHLQLWTESPLLPLAHHVAPVTHVPDAELSNLERFRKAERNLLCELNSADVSEQAAGAHGLWELSVRREHKRTFSVPTMRSLAVAVTRPFLNVATPIAATIWSLAAADRNARASLIQAGVVEALAFVIAEQTQAAQERAADPDNALKNNADDGGRPKSKPSKPSTPNPTAVSYTHLTLPTILLV